MIDVNIFSGDLIIDFGAPLFVITFSLILVILIVYLRSTKYTQRFKPFTPAISILIPTYNEEHNIAACLESIFASKYNAPVEIICIDDGSTDNTSKILSEYKKTHSIIVIQGKHEGKSAALNLGLKYATHDYIFNIDADVKVTPGFLKRCVEPLQDETIGGTNGTLFIDKPKTIIGAFQDIEYYYYNLIRVSFSKVFNNSLWFFGAAAAFRKQVLIENGGFATKSLTEDMDIALRLISNNLQVLTVKDAMYYTKAEESLQGLFRQRMRWLFGGLQSIKKYAMAITKKTFPVYYLYFTQIWWFVFSIIVVPLTVYQIFFWLPEQTVPIITYIFRWFSLAGPLFVLYQLPVWGLNLYNIFGVMAGVLTAILLGLALHETKGELTSSRILTIFFYFPYTLLINCIFIAAAVYYAFSKKRHFVK